MIDFEMMGLRMGFSAALNAQARAADEAMEEANAIIARKNARLGELNREVADLNRRIEALTADLAKSRKAGKADADARVAREAQIKRFCAEVNRENGTAMTIAEVRHEAALYVAEFFFEQIREADPDNAAHGPTGLVYPDGTAQTKVMECFDMAFDAFMARRGLPEAHAYRAVAVAPPPPPTPA
jgi:hypothetical protein